jgi:hypothetical protein
MMRPVVTAHTPLVCGIGQPDHPCDQPAVGAVAVHILAGRARERREPGVVLVCARHLAAWDAPAEAVFPVDQPAEEADPAGLTNDDAARMAWPAGAGTRGA